MNKRLCGTLPDGEEIFAYELKSEQASCEIMSYGAAILTFNLYGTDIVGGFEKFEDYIPNPGKQGVVIGRVANRIEGASFLMDGKEYHVTENYFGHCLHGGNGFSNRVWTVISYTDSSIVLNYVSPDGDEGFPGELDVTVSYTLQGGALIIDYTAIPKAKTPVSLTNHSYFNLDGFGGTVLSHKLRVYSDTYTETKEYNIPTGNRPSVDGTRFDFRKMREIGDSPVEEFLGYDTNYFLSPEDYEVFSGKKLGLGAVLENEKLRLSVYTDQPCIQIYTAGGLDPSMIFKGGINALKFGAVCLETQIEPNSAKHGVGFVDVGEIYSHTCVYKVERSDNK